MKNLFSLIALLMIVLTEAWSNTVTFTPTDFSGNGTKTITVDYVKGQPVQPVVPVNFHDDLAALMGETVYVNTEGISIFVNDEGKLEINNNFESTVFSDYFTFSYDQESGNYVATSGPFRYIFYVKNGKVTKIVEESLEQQDEFLPSIANIEEQIAWLMGTAQYVNSDEYGVSIYVDSDGKIVLKTPGFTISLSDDYSFVADGNDFVTDEKDGSFFRFVVENGKVTKIVDTSADIVFLPEKSVEEEIAELMGNVKYVADKYDVSIYVNGAGKIVLKTPVDMISLSDDYSFMADGNDFVTDEKYDSFFRFVVENGKVTKIVDTSADVVFLPKKSVEEEIAELMGETKYVFTIENDELSVYVDSDGKLICYRGKMNELFTFSFDQKSGNYVAECNNKPSVFTFYVEEGKVTKIVESYPGGSDEYLPKPGTSTAIKQAKKAAKKADKAVKTVENGKIVIIKGGEKYDLTGKKL